MKDPNTWTDVLGLQWGQTSFLKEGFSSDWVAPHVSYAPETNTMKMQLVRQDVHSKLSLVRGVKDYREKHNGEGYEQTKKKTKAECKS